MTTKKARAKPWLTTPERDFLPKRKSSTCYIQYVSIPDEGLARRRQSKFYNAEDFGRKIS
jgi:hypothetical protein